MHLHVEDRVSTGRIGQLSSVVRRRLVFSVSFSVQDESEATTQATGSGGGAGEGVFATNHDLAIAIYRVWPFSSLKNLFQQLDTFRWAKFGTQY